MLQDGQIGLFVFKGFVWNTHPYHFILDIRLDFYSICLPIERVTSRKARNLQREEIGCTCQAFFYLFKWQVETNYKCQNFSFSIQFERFLLNFVLP